MREAAILTAVRQRRVAIAIPGMVHDHARGLHQRITNGRSDEREPGLFQAFAHFHGDGGHRWHFAANLKMIDHWRTVNEGPEKRHRVLQRQPGLGIASGSIEFETIANDPRIEHQLIDFRIAHLRHALDVEAKQHLAITLAFTQHGDP